MTRILRYTILCVWLLLILGCVGCGSQTSYTSASEDTSFTYMDVSTDDSTDTFIYVDVEGAVKNPGVYALDRHSRVCDAIRAAGGFLEDACVTNINQARLLTDGEQVLILTVSEQEHSTLVNINTADVETLTSLPGVGASRAEDIIAYRVAHGFFSKIEDIMQVRGIKEGLFQKIKDKITV